MRNAEYDRFGPWILEITDKSSPELMNCRIVASDEIFTTVMTAANQTLSQYSKFN